ncbi:MAG: hypothetical protein ACTSQI_20910 [Candidatus Helarchaeota archaeon]
MSLFDLLAENPTTLIRYGIFFAVLAIIIPFFGYIGRIFPKCGASRNLFLAKIFGIAATFGLAFTVAVTAVFVYVRPDFISFEFFAVIAFLVPLILGPAIAMPFYLTRETGDSPLNLFQVAGRHVDNRNGAEIFIIYAAFGVVASNFHDVLWCGEKTNWFTVTGHIGPELEIWVNVVGANTFDYVFFGFFMLLHVIFCGAIAVLLLQRYTHRYGEKLLQNKESRRALILAWLGALLWGYGLYIMDKSSVYFVGGQPTIAWVVGTFLWIPLGIFLLGFSARYLSRFEPP